MRWAPLPVSGSPMKPSPRRGRTVPERREAIEEPSSGGERVMKRARRSACAALALAISLATVAGAQAAPSPGAMALPTDAEIRALLADRVGAEDGGAGIVVGLIGPQGRRVVSYGRRGQGDPRLLDRDTVFEIGSVTKVFTALLLADMVQRGEVALADPVAKHLPAGVELPERNGRSIALLDLATHTSSLPFMPEGVTDDPAGATDTAAQLYRFLASYELPHDIGSQWDYSNVGYWLLAEALANRGGMGYEALLRARVLGPLGMSSTAITVPPELEARLAAGHDASLQPAPTFAELPIYSAMPAAGGLASTAGDLLTFLGVAMGYEPSPLAPAMAALLDTSRPGSRPGVSQALGWVVMGEGDDEWVVHDGGTFGYASSVVWDPKRRLGVVVLSNQVASVGDLARHLLRPEIPLEKPAITRRTEIALEPAVLAAYAGRYEAEGEGTFVIAREGDFLTFEAPAEWGLPKLRIRPESRREFFASELPLRVTFESDADGRVTGMLIHPPRGQKAIPASRVVAER